MIIKFPYSEVNRNRPIRNNQLDHTLLIYHFPIYVISIEIHFATTLASIWCIAKSQSMHYFQTRKAIPFAAKSDARFGN